MVKKMLWTTEELNEFQALKGVQPTGDDKGLNTKGQISNGQAGEGYEAVFGEGDSYPAGEHGSMAFHCDTANTTDLVVTGATEETETLGSDSLSTTGCFGGESAGLYILVGSDHTFGGVKMKVETAGDAFCDYLMGEYLKDGLTGGTWLQSSYMVTDADGESQDACDLGLEARSEHWRFGFNPLSLPVPWEKVDMTINGVVYNKYWARFRIITPIVLDPIIQQLKFHTNHFEVNPNGTRESFGIARPPFTIIKNLSDWKNTTDAPKDSDINYFSTITMKPKDNKFEATKDHSLATAFELSIGTDTSIPLVARISYMPNDTAIGNIEWIVDWGIVKNSDILDGSKVAFSQSKIIPASEIANKLTEEFFLLPITKARVGDTVVIQIRRNNATSPNDTYGGHVILEKASVQAYSWRS